MIQAVMRSLGVAAVKGNHRAQLAMTGLVSVIEKEALDDRIFLCQTVWEYKEKWEDVFRRCDADGRPRPDPIPHPHELRVNAETAEVIYNGPADDAAKASWDKLFERSQAAIEEIESLKQSRSRYKNNREFFDKEIARGKALVDLINRTLPDETTRRAPDFDIRVWRRQQRAICEIRQRLAIG